MSDVEKIEEAVASCTGTLKLGASQSEEDSNSEQGVQEVLDHFKIQQDSILKELQRNQQGLQKRMEDAICKGLEGVTKIRYGAQAKEYLEQTQAERSRMKKELKETIRQALDTAQDQTASAVHEIYEKQHGLHHQEREDLVTVLATGQQEIMEAVKSHQHQAIAEWSSKLQNTEQTGAVADALQNMTATLSSLTDSMATFHEKIARGISEVITDAVVQGTQIHYQELSQTTNKLMASLEKTNGKTQEDLRTVSQKLCTLTGEVHAMQNDKNTPQNKSEKPCKKQKKSRSRSLALDRTSDSSDTDGESNSEHKMTDDEDEDIELVGVKSTQGGMRKTHIPPFIGKETWKVWFTRFQDIAKRQKWSNEEKLDMLLPKLQGEAGSFVYDQLSSKVRNDYRALKRELTNRFRKVENPKTYGAVFAGRKQRANETPEIYAAELKKLYDKAHARRDPKTREEDLLRRFLDGLSDTKASFHVEFVKDPKDIDEAVDEVINFQEVKKKQGKSARMVGCRSSSKNYSSSDDSDSDERVARAPGRPPKASSKPEVKEAVDTEKDKNATVTDTLTTMAKSLEELKRDTQECKEWQQKALNQGTGNNGKFNTNPPGNINQAPAPQGQNPPRQNWRNRGRQQPNPEPLLCFNCKQPGHFMRDCHMFMGHMQMATGTPGTGQEQWQKPTTNNGQGHAAPSGN